MFARTAFWFFSCIGAAIWLIPAHAQTPVAQAPAAAPAPAAKPAAKPMQRKMLPVDEGGGDATWVQFRGWLLEVLRREDRRALAGIIDGNVLNPLEAPRGIAAFRKLWDLEGTDKRLLQDLSAALQMGSAWYQPKKSVRLLCAPYVPIKWPLDDVDPYDSGAITVKDALVKDGPSHMAGTLGNLSYDIIGVRDWEVADKDTQSQQRWVKVRYAGAAAARDGFVPAEHIRSAVEYRACFARTTAGWRLMEYVLGIEYLGGED
jgi:hypothetical protein